MCMLASPGPAHCIRTACIWCTLAACSMDFFDDVAALATGEQEETQLGDLVEVFAAHLPQATAQAEIEKPLHSPPSLTWLKAYLSWRVRVAQARLDDRIALTTMKKKLQQVLRIVRLSTGHVYDTATQAQLESVAPKRPRQIQVRVRESKSEASGS
ncbi:hypothetical protein EK21DRAFT_95211 [Setomelanomma holmii]|uniref:Uncharacterized protein n=1 Tax=Setomelanomma holmii TaxID=210430 RepID=A0A9P4LFE4_9PLEO|nr:hypothetical protein EK21DRAFT_95211 [Setomelanomma holmii]